MGAISIAMIVLWILGTPLKLDPNATALLAAAALLLTGVLTWDDLCREHRAWDTFIWFGTLVMMATFLGQLGLIQWFSDKVAPAFGGIGWIPGMLSGCFASPIRHLPHLKTRSDAVNKDEICNAGTAACSPCALNWSPQPQQFPPSRANRKPDGDVNDTSHQAGFPPGTQRHVSAAE